jgi:hypothetical protein
MRPNSIALVVAACLLAESEAFQCRSLVSVRQTAKFASTDVDEESSDSKKDNKAMAFLKKIGKVGVNTDFTHAIGFDEGPSGKTAGKWGRGKVNNDLRILP